jgi:hypothetical protein
MNHEHSAEGIPISQTVTKIRRRGAVTGGIYRLVRNPQYVGLAVMGLGTLLLWSRFLVLVAFVTMLVLYRLLAGWDAILDLCRLEDVGERGADPLRVANRACEERKSVVSRAFQSEDYALAGVGPSARRV